METEWVISCSVFGDPGYGYLDTSKAPGKVTVVSGATGDEIYAFVGEDGFSGLGESLGFTAATLGDVNGDGFEDFSGGSIEGPARIWSGRDGGELFRSPGIVEVVAALGDVNGDGLADFAFRNSSGFGAIEVRAGGTLEFSTRCVRRSWCGCSPSGSRLWET
jgi:hypothetical protein